MYQWRVYHNDILVPTITSGSSGAADLILATMSGSTSCSVSPVKKKYFQFSQVKTNDITVVPNYCIYWLISDQLLMKIKFKWMDSNHKILLVFASFYDHDFNSANHDV